MKKTPILISITAVLLLCAVLCTAGCIEAPSDAIVGSWVSETEGSVTYAVFENGGTGYFAADEDSVLTLEWKANGDTTYTLIFADGRAVTASVNAEHGLMTMSDGSVLEKQANGLSGRVEVSKPVVDPILVHSKPGEEPLAPSAPSHRDWLTD